MIYFVEGGPAVGKSFYSRKLAEKIKSEREVIYFKEEYRNPLDLLRQAVLTKEEMTSFWDRLKAVCTEEFYREIKTDIQNSTTMTDGLYFLPFMHIRTQTEKQRDLLYSLYDMEMDDGKCSYEEYKSIIIKRLNCFLREYESGKDFIFEGALMHNPLLSILGFYDADMSGIVALYREIEQILSPFDYSIHLVQCSNVEKVIEHAMESRQLYGDYEWTAGFNRWFSQSRNYKNLNGKKGIIAFSQVINRYENAILEKVPFNKIIIKREV